MVTPGLTVRVAPDLIRISLQLKPLFFTIGILAAFDGIIMLSSELGTPTGLQFPLLFQLSSIPPSQDLVTGPETTVTVVGKEFSEAHFPFRTIAR